LLRSAKFVDTAAIEARVSYARDVTAVSMFLKPDRTSFSRSVLPATKISDPLTKLGGDRPEGRHVVVV
jgi:hypothetical protein